MSFGPFLCVQLDNEVTLDFLDADGMETLTQHSGVYFQDPSGHLLEIIARPYGKW